MAAIRCQYSANQYETHEIEDTVEEAVAVLNSEKGHYFPFRLIEGGAPRYFSRAMIIFIYEGVSDYAKAAEQASSKAE